MPTPSSGRLSRTSTLSMLASPAPMLPQVAAPVMIAFGEFDIAERPRDEAAFYLRSVDITLFVLAGSYHCHNFQDGRVTLWNRLGAWATEVVVRAPALLASS